MVLRAFPKGESHTNGQRKSVSDRPWEEARNAKEIYRECEKRSFGSFLFVCSISRFRMRHRPVWPGLRGSRRGEYSWRCRHRCRGRSRNRGDRWKSRGRSGYWSCCRCNGRSTQQLAWSCLWLRYRAATSSVLCSTTGVLCASPAAAIRAVLAEMVVR
jgi:hypothetical protein